MLQAACALATFNYPNHLLVLTLRNSKLIGILSLAAFLQLELFRVYSFYGELHFHITGVIRCKS
ncbi:hypothetical protein DVQ84_08720 [Yersinia enterocolitica]|nr:hypothetical protein [Yersinia enterocolitica]QBP98370.1 hypothetical protein YEY1_05875 [Yersinia enterocolitica subsp. palearctica]EKN5958702.1 hypothetical protein [Yersinia enterocolitica]EKN5965848.1 hypothetical protein [Yersinia enterocolitica]EKN5970420.1 hypothetical protein [Yersinia enterocolitica]